MPASAASFDCTHATAPREQVICSDQTLSDARNWIFSQQGIEIDFGPYVLGAGRLFHPSVIVPWSALRDLIVADPPVP